MSYCDHSQSVVGPSSVHTFERLLLWNPWTNFLHVEPSGKGGLKISTNGHGLLNWVVTMPIYVKNIKIFSCTKKAFRLNLGVYSIGDSSLFVRTLGWPLTFLQLGQICFPIHNAEKSFSQNISKTNGWNLQFIIKVVKVFSYSQNFMPWAVFANSAGLSDKIGIFSFCPAET